MGKDKHPEFETKISDGPSRFEAMYQRYGADNPWSARSPSPKLVEVLRNIEPCPAVDLGCGIGQETTYIAKRMEGHSVRGLDISPRAIILAQERARRLEVDVDFYVADVLNLPLDDNSIGFANDRGCLHALDEKDERRYASEVARVLQSGGVYFLRCFSDAMPKTEKGPRHITKSEIIDVFSPHLAIACIDPFIQSAKGRKYQSYCCRMEKR